MQNDEILVCLLDSSSEKENSYMYSSIWFKSVFLMTNVQFNEIFRMDKTTFGNLYEKLFPNNNTEENKNEFIIFLIYISHASTYRKLREMTGVSHSSFWCILKRKQKRFTILLLDL
ncbi:hypothetical protein DMUE_2090 [Dictyocoela muelleri]|nr:hypothetical protein DMUE_2090 [Dictyocoela muelleri]